MYTFIKKIKLTYLTAKKSEKQTIFWVGIVKKKVWLSMMQ